jgi:hypothetical protein
MDLKPLISVAIPPARVGTTVIALKTHVDKLKASILWHEQHL